MKRLVVCTGSRSEYGVLRPLLRLASRSKAFRLGIIASGMHLLHRYGETWREIQADGFNIDYRIDMAPYCDWETGYGPVEMVSKGLMGFANAYEALGPDLVLVEGDRVEALAATLAAAYMGIPVAHGGGGDLTRTIDNAARHSISHFASLHFVSHADARDRLIRYGCDPSAVHVTGGLGIDAIMQHEFRSRAETLADLGLPVDSRYLLVAFHPESEHVDTAGDWMESVLLAALGEATHVVVTYPNSDCGSEAIIAKIGLLARLHTGMRVFPSLGHDRYMDALKHADALVGNSSSGLYEAPTLKVPVVNVGRRQDGRLRAANVLSCVPSYEAITATLHTAFYDAGWRSIASQAVNPYGAGSAAEQMLAVIEERLGA